jgi:hypothetical protein
MQMNAPVERLPQGRKQGGTARFSLVPGVGREHFFKWMSPVIIETVK